jgi:pyrimidine-specific ribonucleoside hydrolase
VALLGAGCQDTSATLTEQQFQDRAGAICQDMWQRLDRADSDEASGLTATIERGAGVVGSATTRLSQLAAPVQLRPAVGRWLGSYRRARSLMREAAAAAHDGRAPSVEEWWTAFAPVVDAAAEGAWSVGAYRCAGPNVSAPPKVAPVRYGTTVREVVIDTDMGADDWMAILYLLRRPDVRVRAITVSGAGLAHCGPGVRNALGLLALAGRSAPVACGRARPLRGARSFPAAWRRRADDLLGLTLPAPEGTRSHKLASELLAAAVRSVPGKVSLLTLGPLTNVADAFARHPGIAGRLDVVEIMGSALAVPGNAPGGSAEWNFHVDPAAASAVLRSGAPITLVPLDATRHVPLERSFYAGSQAAHDTRVSGFVFDVLTQLRDQIDAGGYSFWDPLAAVLLTDDVATVGRRRVKVATRGALRGWTFAATDGAPVRVVTDVPRERFEQLFLSVLDARQP